MASGPILSQLSNPFVVGPLVILTFVFVLYLVFKKTGLSFGGEEEFEKKSLDEFIKPEFKSVLSKFGKKNYSTFRIDLKTMGEIYRETRFSEPNDYDENDEKIKTISIEDTSGSLDDLVKAGVITKNQKENIKKNQMVPHRFIQTRPSSSLLKVFWLLTDKLIGKEIFTEYFLMPELCIVDNPGEESISVKRNVEFRPLAGIYIPLYESSLGILRSVTMRSLYEQALEDQSNYHERVNFFDSQFSQRLQEIDAEAEAEKKKYSQGASSDARGG